MKIIYTLAMLFLSISLYSQEEYAYEDVDNQYLLLVKNQEDNIKLFFQSTLENEKISIYNYIGNNEIELEKTINLAELLGLELVSNDIYSIDYIGNTLYLNIIYSAFDENNEVVEYKQVVSIDDEIRTILDYSEYSGVIKDVRMYNENQGLMLKADTILVTWNDWDKVEKQVFDYEIITNKVAYLGSLRDIVLCERKEDLNLLKFVEIDLLNSSVDYVYSHPIDTTVYKNHYKPYSLLKTNENTIYFSYEFAENGNDGSFELVKSTNNGKNWEKLYETDLSIIYENAVNDFDERFTSINKIAVDEDEILAVNFEKVLYSGDDGSTWKEFEHDFAKGDEYKLGKNIYPMWLGGSPIIFTQTSIVTVDINTNSIIQNSLKVFPNPVRDYLRVEFESSSELNLNQLNIELINISNGKTINIKDYKSNISSTGLSYIELNVDNIAKGAYIINIDDSINSIIQKIIIE